MNVYNVKEVEKNVFTANTHVNPPRITIEATELDDKVKIHINELGHSFTLEK